MKAFVAGATGETGRRIVQQLVEQGIPVRAMVRNRELAKAILPEQAEVVTGDVLKPATLAAAIGDATVIFCATGAKPSLDPTGPYQVDFEGTKNLVNLAKEKGIEQFILVSSLCTSKLLHPLNLFWGILVWKKWAEEYIQNSGLAYTIVRPGGLMNENNDDQIIMTKADQMEDGRIPRMKVAQVCVAAAQQSTARNQIVEIVAKPDLPERTIAQLFDDITTEVAA
ncbi:SDR family oxidoreductase [filamentous cyanobacterium LEGE 11480]|uniref:SDR family oxidoreductase n=1 Tax=Romeriopsis navalis LEGE 11480 TaxID=2777977 RepID=A0A928VI99_9CYAN|nr:SDR family oxidoreductase [Romeriopsis navalis]MBE9029113.1 SDR family oxidoreductase [Romeriopsis navalis LEGE 11480]